MLATAHYFRGLLWIGHTLEDLVKSKGLTFVHQTKLNEDFFKRKKDVEFSLKATPYPSNPALIIYLFGIKFSV